MTERERLINLLDGADLVFATEEEAEKALGYGKQKITGNGYSCK